LAKSYGRASSWYSQFDKLKHTHTHTQRAEESAREEREREREINAEV